MYLFRTGFVKKLLDSEADMKHYLTYRFPYFRVARLYYVMFSRQLLVFRVCK